MTKKVYLAGGFFTPAQIKAIDDLETGLGALAKFKGYEVYSPRRDGTKLTPDQFGNTETRRKVFQDNVDNIKSCDLVVASIDGNDGYLDTGTLWEVGMATAMGIPVYGYDTSENQAGFELLGGVRGTLRQETTDILQIVETVESAKDIVPKRIIPGKFYRDEIDGEVIRTSPASNRTLLIGPDITEAHVKANLEVLVSVNTTDVICRYVDAPSSTDFGKMTDEMFHDVDYLIAVVDDRHPAVAWAMGQAYVRNIPIVSYTNHDYGVNLMLLLSIVRHVKGTDKLIELMMEIKEKGIENISSIDYADVRAI